MNIAVLFGGRSVEHEISIITALQLIEAIDSSRYNIIPVYISHQGKWYTGKELLQKSFYRGLPACLNELPEVTILPKPGVGGLTVLDSKESLLKNLFRKEATIAVDVFIPAFHGQFGEDGCVQGLLEMADAAYAGSDVMSSAVAMNKAVCKAVAAHYNIPVLPFTTASKSELAAKGLAAVRSRILETTGLEQFPLFVKPCHLGSSIGISRAKDSAELDAALAGVFKYDEIAIIERCVTAIMEVNVSVLGTKPPVVSVVEIPVGTEGVLSYEDKYLKGGGKKGKMEASEGMAGLTRSIDPQHLDTKIKETIRGYALQLYEALGNSGVARFDFIIDTATDTIYFNELNPIPGSLSFYLWEKSHPPVIYTELLDRMIARALDRKNESKSLARDTGFKALFK